MDSVVWWVETDCRQFTKYTYCVPVSFRYWRYSVKRQAVS